MITDTHTDTHTHSHTLTHTHTQNDYRTPRAWVNNCVAKRKATPSILAIEVWLVRLHVGWAINRIPHCSSNSCAWLGVGYGFGRLAVGLKNRRRLILDDRQLYVHIHASRLSMRDIDEACMFGIASKYTYKRVVVTCNIIHCVFFFLRFFLIASYIKLVIHNQKNLAFKIQPMVCHVP